MGFLKCIFLFAERGDRCRVCIKPKSKTTQYRQLSKLLTIIKLLRIKMYSGNFGPPLKFDEARPVGPYAQSLAEAVH